MRRREVANFLGLTSRSGISHQPGLDGLRGLAVAAVVAFHTGLGFLPGGYLGVSLFFTLSGVVIGTVIIQELTANRRFSLRRFWSRRARRLLPAAWLVLAVVAIGRLVTTGLSATTTGDVAASWLHVANWHFLVEESSYEELFTGPSALLHFWSLAIEEQFYLAVGLLAVAVGAVSRRPAHLLGVVAAGGALVSFALPVALGLSTDRTYYGTDTRAGELAIGLVLAAYLAGPLRRQRLVDHGRWVALAGLCALGFTIGAWLVVPPASGALRYGLLPVTAAASGLLCVAALVPRGVVWRLATTGALRRLGDISYGLYLVHWPVFIVLEPLIDPPWLRAVAGTVLSILIAGLSARLVELPVRRRRVAIAPIMAMATVIAVVIVTTLVLPARRTRADQFLEALAEAAPTAEQLADRSFGERAARPPRSTVRATVARRDDAAKAGGPSRPTATDPPATTAGTARSPTPTRATSSSPPSTTSTSPSTTTSTTTSIAPPAPPTVGIFGDSIAVSLALSLEHLGGAFDGFDLRPGVGDIGCGALLAPYPTGGVPCETSLARWQNAVAEHQIDVPIVMSCQWELVTQRLPGEDVPRAPGDPVFDGYLVAAMTNLVEVLRQAGAERVLWVRCPRLSTVVGIEHLDAGLLESRVPDRMDRWNQLIDAIDLAREDVTVLDLATWVDARVDDPTLRPDGEHYEYLTDTGVAAELNRLIASTV